MKLARAHHKIIGLLLLQYQPHGAHKICGMTPIAGNVQIA